VVSVVDRPVNRPSGAALLDVWVPGRPVAQGSLKVVGRGRVVDDSPRLRPWRNAVETLARSGWRGRAPLAGPVALELAFTLALPKSAPKSWRARPRWATPHRRGTGDVDKLARAVLDALGAAGVYADDAQVTRLAAGKAFGAAPGVRVRVWPGPPPPEDPRAPLTPAA
jgi:crossover junction endodeoxyribonuclease RusA